MSVPQNLLMKRIGVSLFLILAVFLVSSRQADRVVGWVGGNALASSNRDYLDQSFERSLKLFTALSAIKAALAVVEGTEIGVGFGIEIGDAVQSVYDHVDIAWRTVLLAAVMVKATSYLIDTAVLIDHWVFTFALLAGLFGLWASWFFASGNAVQRTCRDGCLVMSLLALGCYLILPVSVAGGRMLSHTITKPSLDRVEHGLLDIQQGLQESSASGTGVFEAVTEAKQRVDRLSRMVLNKAAEMMDYLFTLIVVYFFDCILFPIAWFLVLFWTTRASLRYLLGVRKARQWRDDWDRMLAKYLISGPKPKSGP